MKIAVIGSGGREHAICHAIHQSPNNHSIFAIPGNPGMASIATCLAINPLHLDEVLDVCKTHNIDLVIPGSEVYLEAGMTDLLQDAGITVFGPTRQAAMIESSKEFAKNLMQKYDIPTATYQVFSSYDEARNYVTEQGTPIVIKYDGLAGGKGVVVATTMDQAEKALKEMLLDRTFGDDAVIIEEYLEGPEFSLMCFVHEDIVIPMPIAQDHKRLLDGDQGPNTGGMGIYSPVPIIDQRVINDAMTTIMQPIANALLQEGIPYTGFLYGGLMATANGPKVIEFNARFGDPEAEVILPKLESDFVSIISGIMSHNTPTIHWSNDYIVGVVMASKGYPMAYQKGYPIHHIEHTDDLVFHMGTSRHQNQLRTNGGRVVLVIGRGTTIQDAVTKAYQNVRNIKCDNLIYRHDIAHQSL